MVDSNEIEGKAQKIGGKVQEAVGDAVGSPGNKAEGVARQGYGKVQDAYGKVADAVGQARDNAGEVGGQLLDQLDDFGGTLAHRIEERPFASVLIAGAIGYALALLTARR